MCAVYYVTASMIVYPCYTFAIPLPLAQHMLRGCYADVIPSHLTHNQYPIANNQYTVKRQVLSRSDLFCTHTLISLHNRSCLLLPSWLITNLLHNSSAINLIQKNLRGKHSKHYTSRVLYIQFYPTSSLIFVTKIPKHRRFSFCYFPTDTSIYDYCKSCNCRIGLEFSCLKDVGKHHYKI